MKEFTIYRDKWNRGKKFGTTFLLNEDDNNNMCCLGFLGKACGISLKRMQNKSMLFNVKKNSHRNYPILDGEFSWCSFSQLNDKRWELYNNIAYSEKKREKELKIMFEEIGFKVQFKDTEK